MSETKRLDFFLLKFIGILILTVIILYFIFGAEPLSNPLAVGILITVMIISCILLCIYD